MHIERTPFPAIALASATALAYEVLLIRLFSIIQWHHFAYMIISLALLGYGISGTLLSFFHEKLLAHFYGVFPACFGLFGITALGAFLAAQQLPFNGQELLWDPWQTAWLSGIYLLLAIPFVFVATGLGLALMHYHQQIGRLYGADLLGAGAGSLAVVLLLFWAPPGEALRWLSGAGMVAAGIAAWELLSRAAAMGWFLAALLPVALPITPLAMSPYKPQSQLLQIKDARLAHESWSPLGLIGAVESPAIPLRYAPGLALTATQEPPPQVAVFNDGDGMSVITRFNGSRNTLAYLDQQTSALPYHLRDQHRVLILGAGGGSDVLQAVYHRVAAIDAVEINPQIVALVDKTYGDFSGHLYERPGVTIHQAEARGFVRASRQHYDLIQISLLDSMASAGLHALSENTLYTVESLQDALRHLSDGGVLAITRWLKVPPRDALKLFATAIEALRRNGVTEAENHLVLIRGWQTSTLLVKATAFSGQELAAVKAFCRRRYFDTAYYPGMTALDANRYNRLREPAFFNGAVALLGPDSQRFLADYKFNLQPATDDRPFFFNFFKWSALPEMLRLRGQGGMPLLEWGYLILIASAAQAVLASVVLILLPLVFKARELLQYGAGTAWRAAGYFLALGLAFLFVEMAFLQKFILFLHHPVYASAAVLAGFLVFAGLGSRYSSRHWGAEATTLRYAVLGIILVSGLYLFLLPQLFGAALPWSIAAKFAVAIACIAPLAFCMGMPFPLGLGLVARRFPSLVPWAWGINGCASVLSAILATGLAIHFGFHTVILCAMGLYALAALLFRTED